MMRFGRVDCKREALTRHREAWLSAELLGDRQSCAMVPLAVPAGCDAVGLDRARLVCFGGACLTPQIASAGV